jgi:hypothetical protein
MAAMAMVRPQKNKNEIQSFGKKRNFGSIFNVTYLRSKCYYAAHIGLIQKKILCSTSFVLSIFFCQDKT